MENTVHYDATTHRVHSVTVFQDHRADVNRRIKVQLKTGRNEVIVVYLPSGLDQDSIRVDGTDAATVFDVIYSPPPPAHSRQPDSVKQYTKKRAALAAERHLFLRQATLLDDYARTFNSKDTYVPRLQDFLEFFIDKQRAINENLVALDDQIAFVDAEAKEEKLSSYKCATKLTVVVLSEVDGEAELSLTYAVPGVSWTPLYDLRASIAEDGDGDSQVVLNYRASVTQRTGESWDGVHLTLSTASPHRGSTIPTLIPQTLSELKVPPPTGAFGMPYISSAPPVSGKPQTATGGLFGATTATTFGDMFGNRAASRETTGGLFGSSPSATAGAAPTATTGGLFDSTATTGTLFGHPASPTAHNGVQSTLPAGGLFGTSTWFSHNAAPTGTQRGLFGPLPTVRAATGGLFSDAPAATGGLFGNPAAAPTATTGGLFDPLPSATTGSLLGHGAATTGGLFAPPTATTGPAPLSGTGPATTATPASPLVSSASAAAVSDSAASATFAIEGLATISSDTDQDSQTHKVSIAKLKFSDVELERIAIPKEVPSVFLQWKIKNTSEYPLLPGQANVYWGNSLVAKSSISHVSPQESFSISLGVDDGVRVTYHPQSTHLAKAGDSLLPSQSGRTSTTSFSQRISLKNNRLHAINNLVVRDQVPVSQDRRIKVSVVEPRDISAGSEGARWTLKNEENAAEGDTGDGIIEWVCSLPVGGSIDLNLAWDITAPVDVQWRSSEA